MLIEVPFTIVMIFAAVMMLPAVAAGAIVGSVAATRGLGWQRVWIDGLLAGGGFTVSLGLLLAYPGWRLTHWPASPTLPFPIEIPITLGVLIPIAIEIRNDRAAYRQKPGQDATRLSSSRGHS